LTEDLTKLYDLGFQYERQYGNCAQCTLAALLDFFNIKEDNLFKAATGLSGGTAGMGNGNCGAYSGSVLFLGLLYGREKQKFAERDKTQLVGDLARQLHGKFMAEYGGVRCHDVQGTVFGRTFNFQNPEEYKAFEAAGGHEDKCPHVVGLAARWTAEIVAAEKEK
jgi:C_GCAxxG_C_C family probable redox protein